jgi:hypothetical protein
MNRGGLNLCLGYMADNDRPKSDNYKSWDFDIIPFRQLTTYYYKVEEIFADYLYNNNLFPFDNNDLREIIDSSGIIPIENSFKSIMLKKGDINDYITKVDVTILFRKQFSALDVFPPENTICNYFSIEENQWLPISNLYEDRFRNDILYRINQIDNREFSYFIFIDNNYQNEEINIGNFVCERINYGFDLIKNLLGNQIVNTVAMSFTHMNNDADDQIALPAMINCAIEKLAKDVCLKRLILVDMSADFLKYYTAHYTNPVISNPNYINIVP